MERFIISRTNLSEEEIFPRSGYNRSVKHLFPGSGHYPRQGFKYIHKLNRVPIPRLIKLARSILIKEIYI
jgi:hypothetical protein